MHFWGPLLFCGNFRLEPADPDKFWPKKGCTQRRSGQIFENFDEARRNPDKLTGLLFGQKVLFQDQGSPTIPRGPIYRDPHYSRVYGPNPGS